MRQSTPSHTPLRSLCFQLAAVELVIQAADSHPPAQTAGLHTLLIFTGGSGTLSVNNEPWPLNTDKCWLLAPGDVYHMQDNNITLYYYRITFAAISLHNLPEAYNYGILPGKRELIIYPFNGVLTLAEALFVNRHDQDDLRMFRQQLRLQELLLLVFEHNIPSEHVFSPAQSVESTIQYMQKHYMRSITVKTLAERANVSSWQYTSIFQKLTGKKPLDYLTELRIRQARQLLLHSEEPLREIASRVGYSDEYYFNRRFRQKTGMTPGQYAAAHRRKVSVTDWTGHEVLIPERARRIVYVGETMGDLLALGVKPIGGDEAFSRNSVYKHRLKKLTNVGFPMDAHRTGSLSPDLIIIATADEREYSRVARIGPTLAFDSFAPLEERLTVLGNWLGKEQEAAAWLEAYNAKNTAMWQRLRNDILKPGETAAAFVYDHEQQLFAMGVTGLSSALYAPGGFHPPEAMKTVLEQGLGFIEVPPEQLPAYAAERIFMLIPEKKNLLEAMEHLMLTPLWKELPAVRNGQIYMLEGSKWNSGDALTREKLLSLLPRLLGSSPH